MRTFSEQETVRREKLEEIRKVCNPYPEKYVKTHSLEDAKLLEDGTTDVRIAGRIIFARKMGKLSFVRIRDLEADMQLEIKIDTVGEERYAFFKKLIDTGDFIGARGEIFTTQTGEKTLRVHSFEFLGKALKPLPEKFHGLKDPDLRYRQRYTDLIVNPEVKKTFEIRSKIISNIRKILDKEGYLEVETPVLNTISGGATARPFITHHNTYDADVFLRISPELTLKKLIIGGFTNIYEIARDFRNEGISVNHLQDFTMIEGYSAYYNYKDNMKLTSDLIKYIISNINNGDLKIMIGDTEVDFGNEWPEIGFRDLILKDSGIDIDKYQTASELLEEIKKNKIDLETPDLDKLGRGNLIDQLYKKVSRPKMINPVFVTKHPVDLSPLARSNDEDPTVSDRFQLVVNGQEIINGYSELVDSKEQDKRLREQSELKAKGDEEAMSKDNEYIKAMEYGMPPISGWGLGIDRFLQFLTSSYNIRDVVLYPLLKKRENVEDDEE